MPDRTKSAALPGTAPGAEAGWEALAARLLREAFAQRGLDAGNAFAAELLSFFLQNPAGALSLREAAAAARRSPDYYGRVCLRQTGFHYHELAALARMASARALLVRTDETVAAISVRLHYSSADYFARVFRRHTGMTPGLYRRTARQDPERM